MDRNIDAALKKSVDYLKAGNERGACAVLIEILKVNPNLEQGWYLLGFAVEELDQKRYAFNQALRINPGFEEAKVQLAKLEEHTVEPDQTFQPSRDWGKGEVADRVTKAISLLKAGNKEAAQSVLREILRANPEHEQAWYLLSYAVRGPAGKRYALRQALRINPDNHKSRARLRKLEERSVEPKLVRTRQIVEQPDVQEGRAKAIFNTFSRVSKYTIVRLIMLFITVTIGVYLTILVANLGGYVDEIFRGMIDQSIAGRILGGWLEDVPTEEKFEIIEQTRWAMEEAYGLHEPFLLRTVRWLYHGLTLNLGETSLTFFGRGDRSVQLMVLERLPYTLVLVGVANLILFIICVLVALFLSRKYGSLMDKSSVILASLNSAPSWIYGIILIVIFAGQLHILPFPKMIDLQYAEYTPSFIMLMLKQMILPVAAIVLSVFFTTIYTWRTFFLLYSREDYVDMAKAKGLSSRTIERRYILRPTLPYVITSFAMMMIIIWQGSIALELLFYWPGIGALFMNAVRRFDTALIVAVVVVFAYLLAITVFILDIIYALVDPRVRVGSGGQKMRAARAKRKTRFRLGPLWRHKDIQGSARISPAMRLSNPGRAKVSLSHLIRSLWKSTGTYKSTLREVTRYPSAVVGFVLILFMVGISIYTPIAIPYDEAVMLWRAHPNGQGQTPWYQNPRNAMPKWVNFFRREKFPETLTMSTQDGSVSKNYEVISEATTEITFSFTFEYPYDEFPDELSLFLESQYEEKSPHVSLTWLTPDGREIGLGSLSAKSYQKHRVSSDEKLQRKLGGQPVLEGLFSDPNVEMPVPLKGIYQLRVSVLTFEEQADIDAEFVLYGRVSGLAGTDSHRRNLMVALLWGMPVALAFGLLGALVTSLAAMTIAAIGVWFGGWVDDLIQRITEVNIILPALLVAIMIFIMYSKSIWTILGVIVLLNIFGIAIKNYRAAFIQVKEAKYIEGARAYGASDWRIISRYMIPRILPVLVPQLVIMVPGYVFFEATLAYLGVSDPSLPTWGKVIYDALSNGAVQGYYYWILEPIGLLILTGLAFALFGFALDRIINPRLRDM